MKLKTIEGKAIILKVIVAVGASCLVARPPFGNLAVLGETQTPVASSVTFSSVGSPEQLVLLQQPSDAVTKAAISPAISVAVEDANGNIVTSATNRVRVNFTGIYGLGGTLKISAKKGIATFNDLMASTAGNYTLTVSSPGLTSTTSTVFTIRPPVSTNNGTTIMQSTPLSLNSSPGGNFQLTYNWQSVPVEGPSSVFVDFVDSTGAVRFQDNAQPPVSTSQWAGPISYTHSLTVPSTTAPGSYKIVAGLESATGDISLVAGPGVTSVSEGHYQVGSLFLVPTCPITSFGAVGDGVTNNATAIQNTFNYAAANHCTALIPAGTFVYSGNVTATGIAVTGNGASSILKPTNFANSALILTGTGGSISNLSMTSAATTRLTTPQSAMIWANNAANYIVQNVLINGSPSVGIFSLTSSGGQILNNTVENTLADSISQIAGANNITVRGNRVLNAGDDGISNNSYVGDPGVVHDITVQGNTIVNNKWGRGLEVSGGSNITFTGNYVDNPDGYSDIYIAAESEWNTQSVANITVTGNTFLDSGPDQGAAIVYNSVAGSTTITGVTVSGNQFVNPKFLAVQFAGTGLETGLVVNSNTDYSTAQFSISSNTSAGFTETGNQVVAPNTYNTPLVSPGGGCTFSGC